MSGRTDLTFELDPEGEDAVVDTCWLLTIHTASDEVDVLVSSDGWSFACEDDDGYFEDTVERPRLSEVFREL
ncbi:hypothetical protein [Saccharothrix hoggarensis]|uniref:Immunity protein 53 of polymorphic toxin system n=1 Tax=Saccharothrix hoggarensis TaxID=913853 RepID=A0ABW3QLF4_9PSEU